MIKNTSILAMLSSLVLGLAACDNPGPAERAGEEIDEAVETLREGGESTGNRIDDAIDELREGAQDAANEIRTD